LVRVTLNVLLLPRATFPKLKLDVFAVRSAAAAIPVPLKVTMLGELERSLRTETLPDNTPATFGVKTTSKVDCFPGPIVRGREMPVILTPAPLAVAFVTVRSAPPSFDIVTD